MIHHYQNPFAVQTPEAISASDVVELFVNVFTDFFNVRKAGHTFLNGPRGSGKSMMFRFLQPDCQMLEANCDFKDLENFAVYVPIKSTDLQLTELARLENKHAQWLINEHLLTIYILIKALSSLRAIEIKDENLVFADAAREFYNTTLLPMIRESGWEKDIPSATNGAPLSSILQDMAQLFVSLHGEALKYMRKLPFSTEPIPYVGPLCGYHDFLLPFFQQLRQLPFIPKGPIFLLIDDADNLNSIQTSILNTWVSYRTSADISLKISTQLNYKTFRTLTGQTIDSPHDYSEVNISSVYTTAKGRYLDRVTEIVRRRLDKAGIPATPQSFFPPNEEQEKKIKQIEMEIRTKFKEEGRGYRESDDVTRYARPIYIASLKGASKNASKYSYSGFQQLVHLSSGIVRHFLEAASQMYGEMQSRDSPTPILQIDHSVQNQIVRRLADEYLFSEFEKIELDESKQDDSGPLDRAKKLRNLIMSLGRSFEQILVSEDSERRIFSIAFSDPPTDEILSVLKLGIIYGYFHESAIGTKDGTGRTRLYILSRRLAPHFTLDPTSFSGYKFVTTRAIQEAMRNPNHFVGRIRRHGADEVFGDTQPSLF